MEDRVFSLHERMQESDEIGTRLNRLFTQARQNNWISASRQKVLTDKIIEEIQAASPSPSFEIIAINGYMPLVSDITLDDYLAYVQSSTSKDWRGNRIYGVSNGWRADLLAGRNIQYLRSKDSSIDYSASRWKIKEIFDTQFGASVRKKSFDYARHMILLNDFLASDFEGTFGEYVNQDFDEATTDRLEKYLLEPNAQIAEFLEFAYRGKGVAQFTPSSQKRTKDLLLDQDRKTWKAMLKPAMEWKRGVSHDNTAIFIQEAKESLNPETVKSIPTPEVNTKELIMLFVNAVSGIENLPPEKFNALVKHGVNAIPVAPIGVNHRFSSSPAVTYRREYARLVELIKEKELSARQLIGLIYSTFYPKLWMRGNVQNAFNLLLHLVDSEHGNVYINTITEVVLAHTEEVPTEKEWRDSLDIVSPDLPPDWFFSLVINRKTDRKLHISIPPEVQELRKLMV